MLIKRPEYADGGSEQGAAEISGTGSAANTGDGVLLNDDLAAASLNFLSVHIHSGYINRIHGA